MNIFYRKPFELSCAIFLVFCVAGHFTDYKICLIAAASVLAALLFCALFCHGDIRFWALVLLIPISLSCLEQGLYKRHIEKDFLSYISDEDREIEAVVLRRLYSYNFESGFEIKCKSIDGNPTSVKMILTSEYCSDVQDGFRIRANVILSDFASSDVFDEKAYYNTRGFYLHASEADESYTVLCENEKDASLSIRRLNKHIGDCFSHGMKSEPASLFRAVFLGDKEELSENIKRDFKRTGTYHLLAISGMHLAVISRVLEEFLKRMRAGRGTRYIILPVFLAFYCVLSGMSLSVVRSAIMLGMSYLAYFVRSKNDRLTSLCFAGAAICAFSPASVSDIGLWLSFFATLGLFIFDKYKPYISLLIRKIENKKVRKRLRSILCDICMSLSAILMTMPFTWAAFGKISWAGPLVTLILSPIISLMLTLSPICLAFSVTSFSGIVSFIPGKLAELALSVVRFASDFHGIYVSVRYSFVPYILVPFFLLFSVFLIVNLKHKFIIPVTALVFVILFSALECVSLNRKTSVFTYYHNGENEYISVSDKGHHVLIDLSDGSFGKLYSAASDTVEYGFDEFDVLILTHLHKKHISAVSKLASREKIYEVWLPFPINETERTTARAIYDAAVSAGAKVVIYKGNMTLFGKTSLTAERAYIGRSTHPVICLTFDGLFDVMYCGSAFSECDFEKTLAENIIIGTHGPACKGEYVIPITDRTLLVSIADEELLSFALSDSDFENIRLMKNTRKLTFRKGY